MRFYLVDATGLNGVQVRMWFPTQDDARAANRELGRKPGDFEAVDMPDDKAGRCQWLNDNAAGRPHAFHGPIGRLVVSPAPLTGAGHAITTPAGFTPPVAGPPVDTADASAVVDHILASRGQPFGRYLRAAVRRLGELGQAGRDAVNAGRDMGTLGEGFTRGAALAGAIALGEIAGERNR